MDYFIKSPGQGVAPASILLWLNELVGSVTTQGTIVKIIDWHIVPMGSQFMAIARVEVTL